MSSTTTRIHRLFNLQWRLQAVQTTLEDLATEIGRLVELEASQQPQGHSKAVPACTLCNDKGYFTNALDTFTDCSHPEWAKNGNH